MAGGGAASAERYGGLRTTVFARDWSRLRDHGDHGLHFGAEAVLARRPHCTVSAGGRRNMCE